MKPSLPELIRNRTSTRKHVTVVTRYLPSQVSRRLNYKITERMQIISL